MGTAAKRTAPNRLVRIVEALFLPGSVSHVRSNFVLVLRRYSMMPGPLPRRYHDEN